MKLLISLVALLMCLSLSSQETSKKFSYKKGEVLDIIFLRQKEGKEKVSKKYFENAIPLAMKLGYQPAQSFGIKDDPLQGNYHPQVMIFGKWPSLEERMAALTVLEKEISDFHEMRRAIWSNFDMTYYELKDDLIFEVESSTYNVATAYWFEPNENGAKFIKDLYSRIKDKNGDLLVSLSNGESPVGYHHDPDMVIITAWKNKKAFDKFKAKEDEISTNEVSHINQFRIQ